jgi:NAD(P)-dependent dehydrogenase (short-subunit alcohol dehydrogenase family)
MRDLEGRAAVVTGAGSGIGRSIAVALGEAGVAVGVADIDLGNAEEVATEIEKAGGKAAAFAVDVSDFAAVSGLADAAEQALGPVSILVNNAGVTLRPLRPLWDTTVEDVQWCLDVNVMGVVHGFTAFVPRMRERGGTHHILSTSSLSTQVVQPGQAAYAASKCAVDGYLRVARHELGPEGFEISVLYPGVVLTNIGTTERLRPEGHRSADREVVSWQDYLRSSGRDTTMTFDEQGRQQHSPVNVPIEPAEVGPIVVRGIRESRTVIMTHPVPDHEVDARADEIKDASAHRRAEQEAGVVGLGEA